MTVLSEAQWKLLEEVAGHIVPEAASLDPEGRARFREIVARALSLRPAKVRRQFALLLKVIRRAPVIRFGASFERLPEGRRERVLAWFHTCPVALLRKGFWGLKALVFMGYYAQPETAPRIHYTPSTDGNVHLHA